MTTYHVTNEWDDGDDFDSSSVEYVGYNANDGTLYVMWQDSSSVYRYINVPHQMVEDAVDSFSVGRSVADIKNAYGPGENLGSYEFDFEPVVASRRVYVVQNDGAPTKEFSLAEVPVGGDAGLSVTSDTYTYELFFDLNGSERSHTITGKKTLDEALSSLNDAAEALGVPIAVKKAVINFV